MVGYIEYMDCKTCKSDASCSPNSAKRCIKCLHWMADKHPWDNYGFCALVPENSAQAQCLCNDSCCDFIERE